MLKMRFNINISLKNFKAVRNLDDLGYNRRLNEYHKHDEDLIDEIKRKREKFIRNNENTGRISTESFLENPSKVSKTNILDKFIIKKNVRPTERSYDNYNQRREEDLLESVERPDLGTSGGFRKPMISGNNFF